MVRREEVPPSGGMVPVERIELPTFGLQNRCTTAVLHRPGPVSSSLPEDVQPANRASPH
jgi:hypothetical protein